MSTKVNESILNDNVKIISCYLADEGGKRVSSCMAGEKYTLSLFFTSKVNIENCIVGFVVETVKGLWIINCNSLNTGIKKGVRIRKGTLNRADFTFEMPSIVNGDYVIGVAVSEGNLMEFKVLTWLYNVLYLQITNVPGNDGILKLDSEIQVSSREMNYE